MARLISFALTTDQVRAKTKTVTRRTGWRTLKPGTLLQPVVKAQGIPKGGHVEKIGGPIRVVSVRRESLRLPATMNGVVEYREVAAEGFPAMSWREFMVMFCSTHGCTPDAEVTRIEFEYVD